MRIINKAGKMAVVADAYIVGLRGEDDNFVELRNVAQEIIHARSFGCPPAMLTL